MFLTKHLDFVRILQVTKLNRESSPTILCPSLNIILQMFLNYSFILIIPEKYHIQSDIYYSQGNQHEMFCEGQMNILDKKRRGIDTIHQPHIESFRLFSSPYCGERGGDTLTQQIFNNSWGWWGSWPCPFASQCSAEHQPHWFFLFSLAQD